MAGVNRVEFGNDKIIDLTDTTVTPSTLRDGITAYDRNGDLITGTGGPISEIDDTAGEGDYDKIWSADKSYNAISSMKYDNLMLNTLYPKTDPPALRPSVVDNDRYIRTQANSGNVLTPAEHGIRVSATPDSDPRSEYMRLNISNNSYSLLSVLDPNGDYTLSFDYTIKFSVACDFRFYKMSATSTYLISTICSYETPGVEQSGHADLVFNLANKHNYLSLFPTRNITGFAEGDFIEIRNIMLVPGTIVFPWKPNPADFEGAFHETDKTLEISGAAADSKVVGDKIRAVNSQNLMIQTLYPKVNPVTSRPAVINAEYRCGPKSSSNGIVSVAEHGLRITNETTAHAGLCFGRYTAPLTDVLDPNKDYTLSFDYTIKFSVACKFNCYTITSTANHTLGAICEYAEAGVEQKGHADCTFKIGTDQVLCLAPTMSYTGSYSPGDFIEIRNIMLVEGAEPAAWKPNPADYEDFSLPKWWEYDEDIRTKIQQLTKKTRISGSTYGTQPFCMIHFSDIHGDGTRLQNLVNFKNHFSEYIQDILHTGDIVKNTIADGLNFWNGVEGAEHILNCIGNHDTRTSTTQTTEAWLGLSMAQCYEMYFAPYINNWGVTCEEGKTYYYKDYTANNVRLIILDGMHERNNADMLEWFEETLESARTAGLHVIAASHIKSYWKLIPYDTVWDDHISVNYSADNDQSETALYPLNMKEEYLQAVEEFIDAGGNFICWLHGHHHYKIFSYPEAYPRQLDICVGSDNLGYENNYIWLKVEGTKSEDDFNVIGVDTYAKILRIVKVGVNYDRYMRHVDTLSFDYGNHRLIYSN